MTQEQAGGLIPAFTIAERLRLARELKKLDQGDLAVLTDSSRSTVRNYENRHYTSKRKPIVLKRWALATGVDLRWLETGEGDPVPGPGKPEADSSDKLARLTARKAARTRAGDVTRRYLAA